MNRITSVLSVKAIIELNWFLLFPTNKGEANAWIVSRGTMMITPSSYFFASPFFFNQNTTIKVVNTAKKYIFKSNFPVDK